MDPGLYLDPTEINGHTKRSIFLYLPRMTVSVKYWEPYFLKLQIHLSGLSNFA